MRKDQRRNSRRFLTEIKNTFWRRANKVSGLFCLLAMSLLVASVSAAPLDMNGDGKTDYVVVRNTGGGANGQMTWFVQPIGGAAGSNTAIQWGIAGDTFVPEDYDGDNKTDIAVWRAQPTGGYFYVLRSSNSTFEATQFGRTGDDPTVVGDYDNDNKADFAVYRSGQMSGDVSAWYYRPSATPGADFTTVYWGQSGDFPAPGDYDGDGKNDFVVQRSNGFRQAIFLMNKSGGGTEAFFWGLDTDKIVPGDYDGDGKTDVCVVRSSAGQLNWYILERDGGRQSYIYGLSASDFTAQGDYTGDGKTDIAVWRPSAVAGASYFFVRPAQTNGASDFQFAWGRQGDYPVANFNSH